MSQSSLRILLVNTRHYYGGGDSTYTFNLALLLRANGHRVAFFAMQSERNIPDSNSDLFVPFIDFRELNRRKNLRNAVKVLSRSIYSVEARTRFAQLLDRFTPDIVHLQNLHAHITPSVIFEAKSRGIPVVWTLHDYKLICPNSHFRIDETGEICEACGKGAFYQAVLRRCKKNSLAASAVASLEAYVHRMLQVTEHVDAFLAPSDFLRSKFLERGYPPNKIIHVPLFVPDEILDHQHKVGNYILFLGKLEPIKGIYQLIDAGKRVPDVKIILAGSMPADVRAEVQGLFPANMAYVGMQHGADLWNLIGNARAVVLPSLWYENQPFSILEAFAHHKPVIASNLGGMSELVGDNARGILISPGKVNELADAMSWIMHNHQNAEKMGEAAYQYILSHHTSKAHYSQIIKIYSEMTG